MSSETWEIKREPS